MGRLLTALEEAVKHEERRLAIAEGNNRITYGELVRQIRRLTEALQAEHPDMCGLVMDQSLSSVLLLLALLESGRAVLPVDDLQTLSDLQRIGHICPIPRWIVPDDKADRYAQAELEGKCIRYSQIAGKEGELAKDSAEGSGGAYGAGAGAQRQSAGNMRFPANGGREAILYQLTSGTTGEPKLAKLALATVLREGAVYRDWFGYTREDRVVLTAPINHLYGLSGGLFASLCALSTLVICRRPTPRKALRLVRDYEATILLGVPQFYKLLSDSQLLGPADCRHMRIAVSAGGPLPDGLSSVYERKVQHRLLQVYGSTETGAVAAHHPDRTYDADCSGELLPDVRAWTQEDGRLVVASPSLFTGYITAQGEENPVRNGSYVTDDLAAIKRGHLYLCGRLPRFVNVAGRKVNPREIEEVCRHMPGIADVKVFGQADQLHGEIIIAQIVAEAGTIVTIKEIKAYLRRHLADYKVPHSIQPVERIARAWKEEYASGDDKEEGME